MPKIVDTRRSDARRECKTEARNQMVESLADGSWMHGSASCEREDGRVRGQAGATWGDVASALAPHDLVITSGNFGDTGVGGSG